ncbi:hypothetical protein C6P47_29670, partial [Klebsiella pneumoniae]
SPKANRDVLADIGVGGARQGNHLRQAGQTVMGQAEQGGDDGRSPSALRRIAMFWRILAWVARAREIICARPVRRLWV